MENGALLTDLETNATAEMDAGVPTGYYYIANNFPFTVEMRAGANLRVMNVTSTTTYTIVETTMPQEFEIAGIALYEYLNNVLVDPTTAPHSINLNTRTINGTIEAPNRRYEVYYTNRLRTAPSISILKVDENAAGLAGANLQILAGSSQIANFVTTGSAQSVSGLKYGIIYTLKELAAPDGYIILNNEIYFKISFEDTIILCDVNGDPITYDNATVTGADNLTLQVSNTPGTALPTTGGTGTQAFTLMGIAVMISSALVWAYHERRKRKKGGVVD
jgi:LPXTG-motif cell wall-anchored protein